MAVPVLVYSTDQPRYDRKPKKEKEISNVKKQDPITREVARQFQTSARGSTFRQ